MDFNDGQSRSNFAHGRIVLFLRRNLFQVRLRDGQNVIAAMPEELLPYGEDTLHQPAGCWVSVTVRLRKRPRIHRIIEASHSGLTC